MPKPIGLTMALELVIPDRHIDALYDAVQECRRRGMTVRQIKIECMQAWETACDEEKAQAREFMK